MYLKRIDIQGFKSFPERTTLLFDKGITSIVGPNGSGKSNIVDCIRWVLGEQSMKVIRGSKHEDVIFTGTEFRKPLGFAEVSLTIDNTDKTLPLEFTEVTITRRIYRSGESEYYINKTLCRLKDINNLLADTGLGKDGYSIIGQGRIDEILSTRSEDRRHIFEEASGIMKYKIRREEAEKKLELTKQNILRITDILNELEFQLTSLKEQAETAEKYLELKERLKCLEVNLYIDTIANLKNKIAKNEKDYSELFEKKKQLEFRFEQIEKEIESKSLLLKELEESLEAARREYYILESNYEKANNEININNNKINSLKENISNYYNEISQLEQKSDKIQKSIKEYEDKLEELNIKYREVLAELELKQKNIEEMALVLEEYENQLNKIKIKHMEKLDLLSDKKLQAASVKSHIENISQRKESIVREINEVIRNLEKEKQKKSEIEGRYQSLKNEIEKSKDSLNSLTELKRKANYELEREIKKSDSLREEFQIKSTKYKMLSEMEDRLEGYNKTVKDFLMHCKKSPTLWKGIRGVLGQLISVDKKYETAIEIALGNAIQNIVTVTEEDAKSAIEFLKQKNLGRATFLPITSVKGKYMETGIINEAKKARGFHGIAPDFVKYDPEYEGIILSLLGRVAVVENLDAGIELARMFKYGFRIVTLEGDVLATTGAISGGSKDYHSHGLLSRAREISDLAEDIRVLKDNLAATENRIKTLQAEINKTSLEIQRVQNVLKEKEMECLRCESQLAHVAENIKNGEARTEMLKQEYSQIIRNEEEIHNELKKYEKEQQEIENEIESIKEMMTKQQDAQRENISLKESLLSEISNCKIMLNSYGDSIENAKVRIQDLKDQKKEIEDRVKLLNSEIKKAEDRIRTISEVNLQLEKSIKSYSEERTGKNIEIDRMQEERKVIEEELGRANNVMQEIRDDILKLNEELNKLNIRKVKDESELESVENRLWDEYELTYSNALQFKKDIGSLSKAQKEIEDYRSRIKELGYVNINSIEEYSKTKERYEFITAQKNDMEDSLQKLNKIILELNAQMEEQFVKNLKLINENFNKVFRELFDGGSANLRIVNSENVLESGIEIEVQPPGKRLQNMTLLSGGEKALSAIALLFSIIMLRPVSFCVLDEIEASLDDVNVNRFASYIKKLSSKSQFILITHKKSTMEVSDVIYGVTMQEKGISKVVSLKMNNEIENIEAV